MDKFSQEDMEESLASNLEEKRKKNIEFWEKEDPEYAKVLKQMLGKDADQKTIKKD